MRKYEIQFSTSTRNLDLGEIQFELTLRCHSEVTNTACTDNMIAAVPEEGEIKMFTVAPSGHGREMQSEWVLEGHIARMSDSHCVMFVACSLSWPKILVSCPEDRTIKSVCNIISGAWSSTQS